MNPHYNTLPVYSGRRYQRGGGILSTMGRFALPVLKKLGVEAAKAVPGIVGSIVSKKASPKDALLQGLKTVGKNTARHALNQVGIKSGVRKRKAPPKTRRPAKKKQRSDIFT